MKVKRPKFALEKDLCAAFVEDLKSHSMQWTAYPETAGWDLLLVRRDGVQVGVQAKLTLNPKVLSQALPSWTYSEIGPDYRAVLVPVGEVRDMEAVCKHVGVKVMKQRHPQERHWYSHLSLPDPAYTVSDWAPWYPLKRHPLPDYVPDVVAGASAPQTLSSWKIAAIKVQIILEQRPVTKTDIKELCLSPSRWFDRHSGFLVRSGDAYVASSYMPDFARQHPTNYQQIKADAPKWMPALSASVLV